mmetsp:Transcript_65016/g.127651  ORF Transcript_65016/g.127651 Transcript_65016/m.127651 type:complete len:274 (+) Transcript_65016:16-837(+)
MGDLRRLLTLELTPAAAITYHQTAIETDLFRVFGIELLEVLGEVFGLFFREPFDGCLMMFSGLVVKFLAFPKAPEVTFRTFLSSTTTSATCCLPRATAPTAASRVAWSAWFTRRSVAAVVLLVRLLVTASTSCITAKIDGGAIPLESVPPSPSSPFPNTSRSLSPSAKMEAATSNSPSSSSSSPPPSPAGVPPSGFSSSSARSSSRAKRSRESLVCFWSSFKCASQSSKFKVVRTESLTSVTAPAQSLRANPVNPSPYLFRTRVAAARGWLEW